MKIMRHHANGRFDWLISGHQSVNPSREAISILSGKYKGFTFLHPVNKHTQIKRETIDAFEKRPAKNLDTRDHLSQRTEWYLQAG